MSESGNDIKPETLATPGEVKIEGYGQWINLELKNRTSNVTIVISAISLNWGKLYSDGDMDKELDKSTVIGKKIMPQESFKIYSCGRKGAASGTEGTVTVKADNGGDIGAVYWNCPWSGSNHAGERSVKGGWIVDVPNVQSDGAIGLLPVRIMKDD